MVVQSLLLTFYTTDNTNTTMCRPAFGKLTLAVVLTVASGLEIDTLGTTLASKPNQDRHMHNEVAKNENERVAEVLVRALRHDLDSFGIDAGQIALFLFPECRWLASLVGRVGALAGTSKQGAEAFAEAMNIFFQLVVAAREQANDSETKSTQRVSASCSMHINAESFLAAVSTIRDKNTGDLKPTIWAAVQAYMMVVGGFETTANCLAYTAHLLAGNQDKQARLLAEIDALDRSSTLPTMQDMDTMPYLRACLTESLRLLPPAPLAIREAPQDTMVGPYKVPKGTWMQTMTWVTHRAPEYWDRPLDFVPERWLAGSVEANTRTNAHLPFGGVREDIYPSDYFPLFEKRLKVPFAISDENRIAAFSSTSVLGGPLN
jgi:hypothetical protein